MAERVLNRDFRAIHREKAPKENRIKRSPAENFARIFVLVFTLTSLIVLYPLVYTVSAAFTPGNSISNLSIIPFGNGFTLEHYERLF